MKHIPVRNFLISTQHKLNKNFHFGVLNRKSTVRSYNQSNHY